MKFLKILLPLFLLAACNTELPKGVLSPKKMIPIVEDIHIVDAMLLNSNISKGDSIALSYYAYIYNKHGISKEQFNTSIAYYAKNPKKLRKVYPQILERLETRDSLLKVAQKGHTDTLQLWEGKPAYTVEKYTTETLPVSIPANYPKTYTISAEIKIYKDSQLKEVSPHFAFVASDTSYVLPTKKITADTVFQKFEIKDIVQDSTVVRLEGDFFPASKDSIEQFKHYEIRKIQITTTAVSSANSIDSIPEK